MRKLRVPWTAIAILLILLTGCETADERLVNLSERSLVRQAEQNEQIARQSQETAETTRSLVAADAQARADLLLAQQELNQGLQMERASLDQQYHELENERRALAAQRNRDPILAGAITGAALLIVCSFPLLVCLFLLRSLDQAEPHLPLEDLLIDELTTGKSVFLVSPTAEPHRLE